MRTRTDNSFMPRIGIAQIAIESKTCPNDSLDGSFYRQSTLPGQSLYIPNYRGNIYDKSFKF